MIFFPQIIKKTLSFLKRVNLLLDLVIDAEPVPIDLNHLRLKFKEYKSNDIDGFAKLYAKSLHNVLGKDSPENLEITYLRIKDKLHKSR